MLGQKLVQLVFVLTFLALASSFDPTDSGGLIIQTQSGPILGQYENGYRVWRGIPYGSATRWSAPEYPYSWQTIQTMFQFGASCPQNGDDVGFIDEDCLFMNIWAPPSDQGDSLPVMVYFHGGAFVSGAGSKPIYSGSFFANTTGTILVTINYRLGILGFLSGGAGFTGNYGFMDQQFALQYVKNNIAAFGGDPNKVTIFGQSAGGMSVFYHLTAPGSYGLFQRAIIESNPTGVLLRTLEQDKPYFRLVTELLKCSLLLPTECLYNKSVTELLNAQKYTFDFVFPLFSRSNDILSWLPTVDGKVLPGQPLDQIKKGSFAKVPIIIGTAANETSSWTFDNEVIPNMPTTIWEYKLFLDVGFENKTASEEAFSLYPAAKSGYDVRAALAQLTTDIAFTCPTLVAANYLTINNSNPVYHYISNFSPRYDPENPFPACWSATQDNGGDGFVCHASELPFVFNSGAYVNDMMSVVESKYAFELMGLWSSFANGTLDNNDPLLPSWPLYEPENGISLSLDVPFSNITFYRQQKCNFLNSLNYY